MTHGSEGGAVVVAASMAQRPRHGGHAWVVLHYLLGFRRLGWKVLLIDRIAPELCRDDKGAQVPPEHSVNWASTMKVLGRFELHDRYGLLIDGESESLGWSRSALRRELRTADFLLNVMGFLNDDELLSQARCRAFLDIDPGFPQMWAELGLADVLDGHDVYLSLGSNVGRPGCTIPTRGLTWLPILPPVVLEHWPTQFAPGRTVTTVATWRGLFDAVEYRGRRYGLRVHEFRDLVEIASGAPSSIELALDIEEADRGDRDRLLERGWQLADPGSVAATPEDYRSYVQGSMAELMVAKGMYVRTKSGWFSDRSGCYLSSGRPVVAQDTGLPDPLAAGDGLLLFTTVEQAQAALADVLARYEHHSAAARALAEDHLDSDKVLTTLANSVLRSA